MPANGRWDLTRRLKGYQLQAEENTLSFISKNKRLVLAEGIITIYYKKLPKHTQKICEKKCTNSQCH
jgi:hypothetical protein